MPEALVKGGRHDQDRCGLPASTGYAHSEQAVAGITANDRAVAACEMI